jgi:hypothetical protein
VTDLNIEFLRYTDSYDSHILRHLNCQELEAALMAYAPTLESLRIVAKFWSFQGGDTSNGGGEDACWGVLSTLNLRRYAMLKHLELAPEVLLGWQIESSAELSTCLPDCLESLHFRFDYGAWYDLVWDFKNLCEKLQRYISCRSSLKHLTVEYFDFLVDDIEIPLASIRSQCEHLGIHFQLKLI